jgi:hypothetical protein
MVLGMQLTKAKAGDAGRYAVKPSKNYFVVEIIGSLQWFMAFNSLV